MWMYAGCCREIVLPRKQPRAARGLFRFRDDHHVRDPCRPGSIKDLCSVVVELSRSKMAMRVDQHAPGV